MFVFMLTDPCVTEGKILADTNRVVSVVVVGGWWWWLVSGGWWWWWWWWGGLFGGVLDPSVHRPLVQAEAELKSVMNVSKVKCSLN